MSNKQGHAPEVQRNLMGMDFYPRLRRSDPEARIALNLPGRECWCPVGAPQPFGGGRSFGAILSFFLGACERSESKGRQLVWGGRP